MFSLMWSIFFQTLPRILIVHLRPLNYFERDADHAVEFMRQIGYEKFNAVGWSDGGITGLVAASMHPDAIERLVVWGANAHVTDKGFIHY